MRYVRIVIQNNLWYRRHPSLLYILATEQRYGFLATFWSQDLVDMHNSEASVRTVQGIMNTFGRSSFIVARWTNQTVEGRG